MPSPELEAATAVLVQSIPMLLGAPLDQQRLAYDALATAYPPPGGTQVTDVVAGGVPAELVCAPGARTDATVLHLHGGGYGIGSPAGYRGFAGRLSAACGASVLVPRYRLAPEARFPAAVEDAGNVYRSLLDAMGGSARVAVSGDSAGGGLALALLAGGRGTADRSGPSHPMPAALVLWSPWADLAVTDEHASANEDLLTVAWLRERAEAYLDGASLQDPLASPVHAELTGLPTTLVLVGTKEILLADARRVVDRALGAGVTVTLSEVDGAVHLWPHFVPPAPESQDAVRRAGRFLADGLSLTPAA